MRVRDSCIVLLSLYPSLPLLTFSFFPRLHFSSFATADQGLRHAPSASPTEKTLAGHPRILGIRPLRQSHTHRQRVSAFPALSSMHQTTHTPYTYLHTHTRERARARRVPTRETQCLNPNTQNPATEPCLHGGACTLLYECCSGRGRGSFGDGVLYCFALREGS